MSHVPTQAGIYTVAVIIILVVNFNYTSVSALACIIESVDSISRDGLDVT